MPTLIYSIAEFRAIHGESVVDSANHCELFPDGARIDQFGSRHEPPTDPQQLLRAKRQYVALKLAQEENDFEWNSGEWTQQLSFRTRYGNSAPGPPRDYLQQLERGKGRIEKLRDELAAFDREISTLPEEVARRAFHEQRRQQTSDAAAALNELRSLRID